MLRILSATSGADVVALDADRLEGMSNVRVFEDLDSILST